MNFWTKVKTAKIKEIFPYYIKYFLNNGIQYKCHVQHCTKYISDSVHLFLFFFIVGSACLIEKCRKWNQTVWGESQGWNRKEEKISGTVLSLTNQCYPWYTKLKWSTTVIQSLYREVIMLIFTAVFVCFLYSCNILYTFTLLTGKHVGSSVHVY